MKKHKKAARAALAVALAAATAAGCFFTACGGESLTSYFAGANEYGRYDDVVYYNDAQKLDVLDGCDVSAMYDDGMAVVSKTVGADTVYGLYDFSGETFVIPMGSSIIISIGNGLYGQTEDYLQGSYQVYSKYGRAAEVSDIYRDTYLVSENPRIYRLDTTEGDICYVNCDTGAVATVEPGLMSAVSEADYMTDEYFVKFTTTGTSVASFVKVYSRETYECVRIISLREHYRNMSEISSFVLGNGNLVIQYAERLPDDADDYELFYNGAKYNRHTLLVDISRGTVTERDVSFIIGSISNAVITDGYEDRFTADNYAVITKITDKVRSEAYSCAFLNNDLSFAYDFDELGYGLTNIVRTGEDTYVGKTSLGSHGYIVMNGSGDIIADNVNWSDNLIYSGGTYYDGDMKPVYSTTTLDSVTRTYGKYVMTSRISTEIFKSVYYINGAKLGEIPISDYVVMDYGIYCVNIDGTYYLYTFDNSSEPIAQSDSVFNMNGYYGDYVILRSGSSYYKVSRAADSFAVD